MKKYRFKLTPKAILILFISTIFVFAIIYSFFCEDFYYSSLEYEYIRDGKYLNLNKALEENIKNDYIELYNSNYIPSEDGYYVIDVSTLEVNRFDYDDSTIHCQVNVIFGVYDEDGNVLERDFILNFLIKYDSGKQLKLITEHEVFDERYGHHISIIIDERINYFREVDYFEVEKIFYIPDNNVFETPILLMTEEVSKLFEEYLRVNKGLSGMDNGTFFRMLYLSMITISTLGYGDIVPLSEITRFFVGLESVLGVVFLGLFVNSIKSD